MIAEVEPGTVVGRENDQGVVGDTALGQRREQATDAVVDLRDHLGVGRGTLALEIGRGAERRVGHARGNVEEERASPAGMAADEGLGPVELARRHPVHRLPAVDMAGDRALGQPRQRGMTRARLAAAVAQGPHVVRIRQHQRLIEPMVGRQEGRAVAEVPLADHARAIARRAQELRERRLRRVQPDGLPGEEGAPAQPDAIRIATREQGRAGGGADGLGGVEGGQADALPRHAVQMRRPAPLPLRPDVRPPLVIGHDEHDVRGGRRHGGHEEEERGRPGSHGREWLRSAGRTCNPKRFRANRGPACRRKPSP